MRITYACPACHATVTQDRLESRATLECGRCDASLPVPPGAVVAATAGQPGATDRVLRCVVCPSTELFARKDFPQRLGVAIVVAGFAASCLTWAWRLLVPTFAILFATALLDVVLYLLVPECLTCYRCGARYSGGGVADGAGGFDLETHERHRQLQARLAEHAAAGGRAGATPAERAT